MRIKTILLTILLLSVPLLAMGEDSNVLRKKIMMDQKKLIVMENIDLTEAEATAFWPVYEKHQEELFQVNARTAELIMAYAAAYQTLTDEQALKLIDEYFAIENARIAVLKGMAKDVSQVLPGKKAFRYMQVESKLAAIGRYELAKEIPLAQ
jgi:hypothetical protein